MNNQQQEITMPELLGMWISKMLESHRRYQIKHAIHRAQRNLELINREIAEQLEAKRHTQQELMQLRAERNSIQ